MRINMGAAVADAVTAGLADYGLWSRGGHGGDHPPVAPVLASVARGLTQVFRQTDSRAFVTLDTRYAAAIVASGVPDEAAAAVAAPALRARAALVVWNHRELPRGALEMLPGWEDSAVTAALARLDAFTRACGPDAGGTVRYGLLSVLSRQPLPSEDAVRRTCRVALGDDMEDGRVRLHESARVPWGEGGSARGLVIELLTDDAPTPCQVERAQSGLDHV
ncbi:hypothetical protein [Caenispirillum salinarum]|uniref:hypothetical protein n=1 Tax=Caenispirillum salinarum TaxID=859058 RepID=UPI00384B77B6